MYQALYRKYRPRCFGDVAGQEHITETLRRQIESGRLSHAYLFVGTRGTGKTTCAKILSRAVNCTQSTDGEPCNKCLSCIGIEDGSILDVLELDAASNNSVDNVRALRDEAIYSPAAVKKRVYIVDEVHMLSLSAFNALLKILEEPPEHILFILATTELHKVPATIQGRCQKFSFKRLSPSVLADRLSLIAEREGLSLKADAAERLAALADGSMRDGISLLDQCAYDNVVDLERIKDTLGLAGQQELLRLLEAIKSHDALSALKILDELYNDGRDMASLLGEMTSLFRDLLVFKLSPDSGLILNFSCSNADFSKLSENLTAERLFFCLDVLKTALFGLQRSGSSKLAVEMCIFKMCDERLCDNSEALLSRISQLEAGGVSRTAPAKKTIPVNPAPVDPAPDDIMPSEKSEPESASSQDKTEEPPPRPAQDKTEEPSPCPESGDFWAEMLKLLKNEPSVYALLSDGSKVQAQRKDNTITVNVTDEFTAGLVKSDFSELIKDAAKSILGHEPIIQAQVIETAESDKSKSDKLESLSAFNIVNFE